MELENKKQQTIAIAAHRGASMRYPENSLAAMKEAINIAMEHPDTHFFVEMDVRKTLDHFLVLMHDSDVARTTYGEGRVENLSLDKLQSLEMRSLSEIVPKADQCPKRSSNPFFPITDKDFKIPTLAEVMALVQTANEKKQIPIGMAIEIKRDHPSNNPVSFGVASLMSGISELLNMTGLKTSSEMISPPSETSRYLASLLNHVDTLPPVLLFSSSGLTGKRDLEELWEYTSPNVRKQLNPTNEEIFSPTIVIDDNVTDFKERIKLESAQHGKRYWVLGQPLPAPLNTTAKPRNSTESIQQAIDQGANIIGSDYPDRVIQQIKKQQVEINPSPTHSFLEKVEARAKDSPTHYDIGV